MKVHLNEDCYIINNSSKGDHELANVLRSYGTNSRTPRVERNSKTEIKRAKKEFKTNSFNQIKERESMIDTLVHSTPKWGSIIFKLAKEW